MIKDFFFILKMLGFTVLVALVMSVKIGSTSLDDQFDHWVKTSIFVDYIQEAIDGGIVLTKLGYKKADTGARSLLARVSRHHRKYASPLGVKLHRFNEDEDGNPLSELRPSDSPKAHARAGSVH